MIRITSQKRRVLVWLFFSLLASGACFYYFRYMYIAGSRVPFMDFFKWIAMYAEDVHNGAISVMQFFTDVNEQVQPGALALVFWLLECTDYDVWPLMILGAIIQCVRCVIIGAIAMIPCAEAMIRTEDGVVSIGSYPRDNLKRTQTPQGFPIGKICDLHRRALEAGITNSVASCTLMIEMGEQVYFSAGSEKNIKLTTVEDIDIFKALLIAKRSDWLK